MFTAEQVIDDTSAEGGSSYVQSLLDPAVELGGDGKQETRPLSSPTREPDKAAEKPAETEPAKAAATTDKPSGTQLPTIDELIQQYATETGLDSNDPNSRVTLKRLADKELFILKLQSDNEALKATAASPAAPELLTDFEKELRAETAKAAAPGEQKPAEAAQPQQQQQPQEFRYGDVGDDWKTPQDSLTALNDAWANNDLAKAHDIEVARLRRNFDSVIAPHLLRHVEKIIEARMKGFVEKDLGDVVPEVRRTITDRRVGESRDFAVEQLRKAGAKEIDDLFVPGDGPPIEFEGQQFPNTPLNRILVKHPEIMRIVESHSDPRKAEQLTFVSRYKLAYQLFRQQGASAGTSAATAAALVKAGREAGERKPADRARQGINAGPGATGVGSDKGADKSYVSSLNHLPGEIPFSSIL